MPAGLRQPPRVPLGSALLFLGGFFTRGVCCLAERPPAGTTPGMAQGGATALPRAGSMLLGHEGEATRLQRCVGTTGNKGKLGQQLGVFRT